MVAVGVALAADLEKNGMDVQKFRISVGDRVLSVEDAAKKGVVETDYGTPEYIAAGYNGSQPYIVRWDDGCGSGWLGPAEIVMDEDAALKKFEELQKKLEEQLRKLEELQAKLLGDFDALSADQATPEKSSLTSSTTA